MKNQTLAMALLQNISLSVDKVDFSVMRNTGCLLILAPLIILFAVSQRQLVAGIERAGIVG